MNYEVLAIGMVSFGEKPKYWDLAKKVLSENDAKIAQIIEEYQDLELVSRGDLFFTLIRSIICKLIYV